MGRPRHHLQAVDAQSAAAIHGVAIPDRLLTVEEAADLLGMGRSTLYRLIRSSRVPYRLMPTGQIRLSPADVDQILEDAHRPRCRRSRGVRSAEGPSSTALSPAVDDDGGAQRCQMRSIALASCATASSALEAIGPSRTGFSGSR